MIDTDGVGAMASGPTRTMTAAQEIQAQRAARLMVPATALVAMSMFLCLVTLPFVFAHEHRIVEEGVTAQAQVIKHEVGYRGGDFILVRFEAEPGVQAEELFAGKGAPGDTVTVIYVPGDPSTARLQDDYAYFGTVFLAGVALLLVAVLVLLEFGRRKLTRFRRDHAASLGAPTPGQPGRSYPPLPLAHGNSDVGTWSGPIGGPAGREGSRTR